MKYTTVIAAGLAAGASADDWNSWTSSMSAAGTSTMSCPKKVTQTVTVSADCAEVTSEIWKTTMTVKAPETETVTVYADGKTIQELWEQWTYAPAPVAPTSLPHGCVPKVATETATAYNTKKGSTTTVTKSTLFVGAGDCASTTITITATGSAPSATWAGGDYGVSGYAAPSAESSSWSGSDVGSDSDNSNGWNGGEGPAFYTAPEGWKIPVGQTIVNTDGWKYTVPAPTNTKSYEPPQYTQKPDGSYGYEWGSWDPSPVGGNNGTAYNITAGSDSSNVTKPIVPLGQNGTSYKGASCNAAGGRDQWCDGKSVESNYYEEYFSGNTCYADFTLSRSQLNLDGDIKEYVAINGQVPGPLIECNWGDIIQVTVHNAVTDNGTSIHWHGFRQLGTNNMDGVPGITECPIAPGESKTYTFHASSYGTTWYHSHWISQYGDGAYGPIIIHGPATADYDYDMGAVMISDTFNVTAAQQNDIIAHQGPKDTVNYLLNGHNVKYDLSGGQHTLWEVDQGKKYLFRFVNSAAQDMYSVSIDGHEMTVIAADFVPIVPYTTSWLNIGIGQRYDVVVEMDQDVDSYFMRSVTQTGCPSGCDNTGLGNANGIIAYKGVNTMPYYLPTSTTTKTLSDFNTCADEPLASLVPKLALSAGTSSAFAATESTINATQPLGLSTTDNGVVFQWFLNNGAINVNYTQPSLLSLQQGVGLNTTLISNPIVLNQQQWYYFIIQNQFVASHPMHLHGHDFAILGQGSGNFDAATMTSTLNFDSPMRRDTAMLTGAGGAGGPVSSSGYTVIGFETDNPGAWLMHCHIIWHVDGGLALQWIERPDDIDYSKQVDSQFEGQCSAYTTYETNYPAGKKLQGSAGLKRSSPFFDDQVSRIQGFQFDDVVRRSDKGAAKHYLDSHMRRSFGDGSHPRHFARK